MQETKETTIAFLERISSACPTQWEGKTITGEFIYIRYRWGHVSISIDSIEIACEQIGEPLDGLLDEDELHDFISQNTLIKFAESFEFI